MVTDVSLLIYSTSEERFVGTPVLDATTWGSLTTCDTFQIVGPIIIDELVQKKLLILGSGSCIGRGATKNSRSREGEVSHGRGGQHPASNLPSGEAVRTGRTTVHPVKLYALTGDAVCTIP
jgi:hypothetical protein